jgi:hypothetical protein
VFAAPPVVSDTQTRLAEGIAKAAKADCRTAYANLGLLAVIPLLATTISDKVGCNW